MPSSAVQISFILSFHAFPLVAQLGKIFVKFYNILCSSPPVISFFDKYIIIIIIIIQDGETVVVYYSWESQYRLG